MIFMDVIIQKKRPRALSVSAVPSQLSQRESQGRLFGMCLYFPRRLSFPSGEVHIEKREKRRFYPMVYKMLVINPGSTSTKVSYFENEKNVFTESIFHDAPELLK